MQKTLSAYELVNVVSEEYEHRQLAIGATFRKKGSISIAACAAIGRDRRYPETPGKKGSRQSRSGRDSRKRARGAPEGQIHNQWNATHQRPLHSSRPQTIGLHTVRTHAVPHLSSFI